MKFLRNILTFVLGIYSFMPGLVYAAALEVTPVHLHLTQNNPTDAFTLYNKGDAPVLLQVNSVKWTQKNGINNYQKTQDIIVNPPIFTVAAQDSQVVRVGLRNAWKTPDQEISYRIYITEVDKKLKHSPGVRTLLRLSMPVFVVPSNESNTLQWTAEKNKQGNLVLHAFNQGNAHVQISQLKLSTAAQQKPLIDEIVFAYILPHQSKSWNFKLSSQNVSSPLNIIAETNTGKITANAKVAI